MDKRRINPLEYAGRIAQATPKGVLFTTKAGDEVDTMVIGWGFIGTFWGKPMFVAYIRESRHSFTLCERSGEFTVNVPTERLDPRIFKVAGTQTGRRVDKVAELGLTLVPGEEVAAPAIAEAPITLECKVAYKQMLDPDAVPGDVKPGYYPADVTDPDATGANAFYHMAYYGEIVASYVLEG